VAERTVSDVEQLDLDPVEAPGTGRALTGVDHPADGTWSPEIEGDGTGQALPPIDDSAHPPGAVQLPGEQ
jgi:hypothetical protein